MLTLETLTECIAQAQERVDALSQDRQDSLDRELDIDFEEHFIYQEQQARAHASGILDLGAANLIYRALGEVGSYENGGWASHTDLATKAVVTQIMAELLSARVPARYR